MAAFGLRHICHPCWATIPCNGDDGLCEMSGWAFSGWAAFLTFSVSFSFSLLQFLLRSNEYTSLGSCREV